MANGEAGECYWTVAYAPEGGATVWNNEAVSGKFPIESEAIMHQASVTAHFANVDPGVFYLVWPMRICCGKPLPGEV